MLPNLDAEMARIKLAKVTLAKTLGIGLNTLIRWFNNPDLFKFNLCRKTRDIYFPTMTLEYLFSEEVLENPNKEQSKGD